MNAIVCTECSRPLPPDAPQSLCPYCLLALDDQPATVTAQASAGNRFVPPKISELQQHFDPDQIELLELIGSGGMGAVFHARQLRLQRDIALKVLPPELASRPGFDDRFVREARVLARLDHDHVVDVYDFGVAGPYSYLMLEYVEGVNLRTLMATGTLTAGDAMEIVPQICDALQYAHEHGVVHRDIKPENILVNSDGNVKITDFGLAKLARGDQGQPALTGTDQVMGTPHYMAPEQIEKPQQVDHRADIYALGVVFYELLTGELPLGRFDPPSRKAKSSRRLDRVVMKSLQKEPAKRYSHASEVKTDVEKVPEYASRHVEPATETPVDDERSRPYARLGRHARQAVESWVVRFARRHPASTRFALTMAAAGAYGSLFLAVISLTDPLVVSLLWFIAGIGLCLLVTRSRHLTPLGPKVQRLIQPMVVFSHWIERRWRGLVVRIQPRGSWKGIIPTMTDDPSILLAPAAAMTTSLAVMLTLLSINEGGLFPYAMMLLVIAFVIAKVQFSRQSFGELSAAERWCLVPPVLILWTFVAVPLMIGPALMVAVLIAQYPNEVTVLLPNGIHGPDSIPMFVFSVMIVGSVFLLWQTVLLSLARIYRRPVQAAAFPLLRHWDGRGTVIAAIACGLLGTALGMIACTMTLT